MTAAHSNLALSWAANVAKHTMQDARKYKTSTISDHSALGGYYSRDVGALWVSYADRKYTIHFASRETCNAGIAARTWAHAADLTAKQARERISEILLQINANTPERHRY